MKGYWTLLVFMSMIRFTVGYPACCSMTEATEEVHLVCRNCNLKVVPNGLPVNITLLDLSLNKIRTIYNYTFKNLKYLKSLSFNSNNLNYIHRNAFDGLSQLTTLHLYNNLLRSSIDGDVFCPLSNLIELDLKHNLYHLDKIYPENALACLHSLQSLYIDIFDGYNFGNSFKNLTHLNVLEFLSRGTVSVKNSSFLGLINSPIEHLILSFQLNELQINALSPFLKLQYLTIRTYNYLGIKAVLAALYGIRNRTMEVLDIGGNTAAFSNSVILQETDIVYLKTMCVKRLSLDRNGIAGIPMKTILSWTSRICLQFVDVSNNKFVTGQLLTLLPLFPALTYLIVTHDKRYKSRPTRYIPSTKTVFVPSSLLFINASYSSLNGDLPNLTIAEGNSIRVLDVSYPKRFSCSGGLMKGLVHLTDFYMSGIDCSEPHRLMFSSMKNLTKLTAISCNFGQTLVSHSGSLFKGLYHLTSIDLTNNHLNQINRVTFAHQTGSLKFLVLSQNDIERVPSEILETTYVLETLDLTHNVISTLTETEYNLMENVKRRSKMFKLKLSDNHLLCTCDHVKFLLWIMTTEVIADKDNLTCLTTDGHLVEVNVFLETIDAFQKSCESGYWLIVSLFLFTSFLTAGLIVFIIRKKKCYWILRQKSETIAFEYDTFVAYSHHDSTWFRRYLVPTLEEKGITFCCYDLNFEAGKSISDNIIDAIKSSRKILFLVSYNFIHSEWGTYEMGIASKFAFRDGRENMNIIIFLEDIKRSEMPRVLRKIWDQVVCLKWPTDQGVTENLMSARKRFWKMLSKSLRKGNNHTGLKNRETAL